LRARRSAQPLGSMNPRRRNMIAIAIVLTGGAIYFLWQELWGSRYNAKPDAVSAMFGFESTPTSMSAASCRQEWPECGTDYVVTACVGSISPSDFPRLISSRDVTENKISGTSHQLIGFRIGPSFDVAVAYRVNTTTDSPDYVSLPEESGYGDLLVYTNSERTRYAVRKRILTAVDCF
jgi:hypothetical protein